MSWGKILYSMSWKSWIPILCDGCKIIIIEWEIYLLRSYPAFVGINWSKIVPVSVSIIFIEYHVLLSDTVIL